jgi:hypothetical protein
MPDGVNKESEVKHVHKGACHDAAESSFGVAAGQIGWDEMTAHITHLVLNVGLTPDAIATDLAMRKEAGLA